MLIRKLLGIMMFLGFVFVIVCCGCIEEKNTTKVMENKTNQQQSTNATSTPELISETLPAPSSAPFEQENSEIFSLDDDIAAPSPTPDRLSYREEELYELIRDIPECCDTHTVFSTQQSLTPYITALRLEKFYEEDKCDCSEMVAFLDWWLECYGTKAYIISGYIIPFNEERIDYINDWYFSNSGGGHAWIVIYFEDGTSVIVDPTRIRMFYDVTQKYALPRALEKYYVEEKRFENLSSLFTYYSENYYYMDSVVEEYDWWTTDLYSLSPCS